MDPLSSFLDKFRSLAPPQRAVAEAFVEAVHELLDVRMQSADVSFQKGVVHVRAPAVVKSEIMLHERQILGRMNEKLSARRLVKKIA